MSFTVGGNNSQSTSLQLRSDTYSSNTSGVTIDVSSNPLKNFAIQVTSSGSLVSWTVVLEVSLNGVTFTPVLTHTDIIGVATIMFSGSNTTPALYFRSRCVAKVGSGTVTAIILGVS